MKSTARYLCFALLVGVVVFPTGCSSSDDPIAQVVARQYEFYIPSGGGNLMILNHGGEGLNGNGGEGGYFEIYAYAAGDIRVLDTGTIDTAFTVPTTQPELGTNVRTIATDTTLLPDDTFTILGDDGMTVATGLHVLAGVTLTLRPNYDVNSDGTLDAARVNFDDGVIIDGTIATGPVEPGPAPAVAVGPPDTADLDIDAANFLITATGMVDTRGENGAAGEFGGDGGTIRFYSGGTFISRGSMMAYGGNGTDGGDGGDCDVTSDNYAVYNTGPVSTYGGTGSTGAGGDGGYIDMDTDDTGGGVRNSGMLISRGGHGATAGGDGGDVDLSGDNIGEFVNSGDVDAVGGNATMDGNGGEGGSIYFYAGGSHMRVTGNLVSRGGNGAGVGDGGDGDFIELYLDDNDYIEGDYSVEGMFVGANMDARGGDGANGGDGGTLYIYPDQDSTYLPGGQPVIFAGYAGIDGSGGNGTANGGSAYNGTNYIYNDAGEDYEGNEYVGDIEVRVPIDFSGGNGGTGNGGNGADLDIYNYEYYGMPLFGRVVHNMADIDLSGGNGATFGGQGGDFYIYDYYSVINEGDVDTSGGSGGTGDGGEGGEVEILGDDLCECRANIDTSGGNTVDGVGGSGGYVAIAGRTAICHGNIDTSGGNSPNGTGGNGRDIEVWSTDRLTDAAGQVDVGEGTGNADGNPGEAWLDGIKLDLTGGVGIY
jgi:hypothetical protein